MSDTAGREKIKALYLAGYPYREIAYRLGLRTHRVAMDVVRRARAAGEDLGPPRKDRRTRSPLDPRTTGLPVKPEGYISESCWSRLNLGNGVGDRDRTKIPTMSEARQIELFKGRLFEDSVINENCASMRLERPDYNYSIMGNCW